LAVRKLTLTADVHIKIRDESFSWDDRHMHTHGLTFLVRNICIYCAVMIKYVICYVLTLSIINVLDYCLCLTDNKFCHHVPASSLFGAAEGNKHKICGSQKVCTVFMSKCNLIIDKNTRYF
jgi:hypothetical protein